MRWDLAFAMQNQAVDRARGERHMLGENSFLILSLAAALAGPAPAHARVSAGASIGTPAPPPVVKATAFVPVAASAVHYAPGASYNLFAFGGRYYSLHEGVWFHAAAGKGAWTALSVDRVPRAVLAVPIAYYRVPPGHAKKTHGDGSDRDGDHAAKGKKDRD
jgi:hypothetical protein